MGPVDNGKTNAGPMMVDWAGVFPLPEGGHQSSVCEGESTSGASITAINNEVYCDANLIPKEFVEKYDSR